MAKRKVSVLLKEDVNKLGKVGDLVEVKPGYARNYLIPQGKAISPTPGILKQAEYWREVKQWRFLEEKRNAEAQKATLEAIGSFSIYKQTREAETIYGTVTNQEIAGIIFKTTGYELDRRKIDIPKIGKIGGYTAKVKLHPEVKASLNIQVQPYEDINPIKNTGIGSANTISISEGESHISMAGSIVSGNWMADEDAVVVFNDELDFLLDEADEDIELNALMTDEDAVVVFNDELDFLLDEADEDIELNALMTDEDAVVVFNDEIDLLLDEADEINLLDAVVVFNDEIDLLLDEADEINLLDEADELDFLLDEADEDIELNAWMADEDIDSSLQKNVDVIEESSIDKKHINAWISEISEGSRELLIVGESYTLNFQVGDFTANNLISTAPIDNREIPESGLNTNWVVSSSTVQIKDLGNYDTVITNQEIYSETVWLAQFSLLIPRYSQSEVQQLQIVPIIPENSNLTVLIFANETLYRQFDVNLDVADSKLKAEIA